MATCGACDLGVTDVDRWHAGWAAAGYEPGAIEQTSWGGREFRIIDPAGNIVRVRQPT